MYSLSKEFKFEYAHRLFKLIDSPCHNLHGHSAKIIVNIDANFLNPKDMVIDFSELRPVQKWLDENWDHSLIVNSNDLVLVDLVNNNNFKNFIINTDPTSEVMARILWDKVAHILNDLAINWDKLSITFYETANNCATYSDTYKTV